MKPHLIIEGSENMVSLNSTYQLARVDSCERLLDDILNTLRALISLMPKASFRRKQVNNYNVNKTARIRAKP